ncbi:MAG: hypothetical protein OXB99_10765 [Acidimicrobiaceae bacterium]|nr:hypothetical protein [Acidimicrobiaceae bacterium]
MSAIDVVVEPSDDSARPGLGAALAGIARATTFYDFENAWITGLRMVSASDGADARDRVLAAAGERLSALGELQDDVARRSWLDQIAEEVRLRSDGELSNELERVAAAELREAFAHVVDDLSELRNSVASGESLNEFAARRPRSASRIRDLGHIAETLRGSGLLALCPADDYGLARDLARAMKPPVHLVPTVPESLRVNRDDLLGWAKSDRGDKEFPRLVRSLIAESEPWAGEVRMPAGTGVASPGWDGTVQFARGNRFVPVGKSLWELTTQQTNVDAKAASDYSKRVQNSSPDERTRSAYVAAACARWPKAQAFASERTSAADFDKVVALNVDDLESWLECAIATTIWMREQIGKPTAGITLLATWWRNWLAATTTPLDAGFVLAGREEPAAELRDRCAQNPGVTTIGGQVHREEIIAFVAAALSARETERRGTAHVLYVDSHDTAARLFAQETLSTQSGQRTNGPVLTMVVPSAEFAKHLPAGSPHRMIVPVPGSPQAAVTLGAVDSEIVAKRLELAGFELHEAHEIGSIARTSLIALRRRLANDPALHTPDWATGHIDATLRACLLIGGWDETREGDREVVAQLTGIAYGEATEMLRTLDRADAPLVAVDEQWYGVSPADTWVLLRDQLTPDDINRFAESALKVLTDADPLRELTGEDLLRARLDGVRSKCSLRLKRGMATTLALAGSLPPETLASAALASNLASRVTSQLLRTAIVDPTPRTWLALVDVLPLLGEAAPDAVLQALRSCLADPHAFAQSIFVDSSTSPIDFGPSSPHIRVLDALEVIAWSPEHLSAVADVLARLDELDSDGQEEMQISGRDLNRPLESLASISCSRMPHTSADTETRLATIRMLRRNHGDVAWKLMLSMLPSGHEIQVSRALPQYRDWRSKEPIVTATELADVTTSVAEMLIEDVSDDLNRWVDLIERIGDLPTDLFASAISVLDELAASGPDEAFKCGVWPALKELTDSHRQFHDAKWALPQRSVDRLEQVRDLLRPAEPAVAFGRLFSSDPPYIDGVSEVDGYETYQAALRPKQMEAVETVLFDGSLSAVLDFAASVDQPRRVGVVLGKCDPSLDVMMLGVMETATEPVTQVALGYFDHRFASLGWNGFSRLLATHSTSAQVAADVLRAPPPIEKSWTRVDAFGAEVATEYWARVTYYDLGLPDELSQLLLVCHRLREAGRIGLALELLALSSRTHTSEAEFASEAADCLEQWVELVGHDAGHPQRTRRIITTLFKSLDEHRDSLGAGRVAMLEWRYYSYLRRGREPGSPNLYREMARNPGLFVQLVGLAFKPASVERDSEAGPSESQKQMALNAYRVLDDWPASQFAPGIDDDGKLDAESLGTWVDRAREDLAAIDRADIGDEKIGTAMASSPAEPNGDWPAEAVRDLLERMDSDDIDQGLLIALRNQRGVTSRAVTEGGEQERVLAERYRADSRRFQEWPRTAAIFTSLAQSYEHDAGVHDRDAESRRRGL